MVWGIANLGLLGLWLFWRTVPSMPGSKHVILFAPHGHPECQDLVRELYERFCHDFDTRRLSTRFRCKWLASHWTVHDHFEAHDLLYRTGARLLIHGTVSRGKVKGAAIEGFRSVSFVVRHKPLEQTARERFAEQLASAIAFRSFAARDSESFIDKDVVSQNLGEVSSFFLALALAIDGQTAQARDILQQLLSDVKPKLAAQKRKPRFRAFIDTIETYLSGTIVAECRALYEKELAGNITDRSRDSAAEKCQELLLAIKRLGKHMEHHYQCMAIIHFHFGRVRDARQCVEKASNLATSNLANQYLSFAFLALWQESYDKALRYYLNSRRQESQDPSIITDTIQFLDGVIRNNKDKPQLRFGLAFVNDHFCDLGRAIEEYKTFLHHAGEATTLQPLVSYADRRVQELSGQS